MGSYAINIQVHEDGKTLLYTVTDSKTQQSLTAHQKEGNSVSRKDAKEGELGTTYQHYIWTEQIDNKKIEKKSDEK